MPADDADLDLLNRTLRAHCRYRPGMRFIVLAAGACGRGTRWYAWEPASADIQPFLEASAAVPGAEFVLGAAARRDGCSRLDAR